jgi:AmmeMemoRadiSam system protein A
VTLRRDGQLRGCIGTLEARRPLAVDVAENAVAAASRDPRFPPLTPEEEVDLEVKISVLTSPQPLDVHSRAELAAAVRPGVDGLLIEAGIHRGTFLPAVWEQLPTVDDFLDHLWAKAGLAAGDWPPGLTVARYRSEEF